MLPYVWLSLAIASLWLPPQPLAGPLPLRHAVSLAWLIVAITHAYATGLVAPLGVLAILAFALLCYRDAHERRAFITIAVVVFSLALMAHIVPGFANLLVVRGVMLSPDAVPYTLYLNFDKAQVGLFLLAFAAPSLASRAETGATLKVTLPGVLVLIAVLMACAMLIGQIRLDFKWPAIFPVWAWPNLLFTCMAEETLFRGVIQRRLQGELATPVLGPGARAPDSEHRTQTSGRDIAGLVMAAGVFGLAHYAGGVWAVVLATIAGVGYGWIFWRTNRIEASILAHFLVNTTHILCFTYPARA